MAEQELLRDPSQEIKNDETPSQPKPAEGKIDEKTGRLNDLNNPILPGPVILKERRKHRLAAYNGAMDEASAIANDRQSYLDNLNSTLKQQLSEDFQISVPPIRAQDSVETPKDTATENDRQPSAFSAFSARLDALTDTYEQLSELRHNRVFYKDREHNIIVKKAIPGLTPTPLSTNEPEQYMIMATTFARGFADTIRLINDNELINTASETRYDFLKTIHDELATLHHKLLKVNTNHVKRFDSLVKKFNSQLLDKLEESIGPEFKTSFLNGKRSRLKKMVNLARTAGNLNLHESCDLVVEHQLPQSKKTLLDCNYHYAVLPKNLRIDLARLLGKNQNQETAWQSLFPTLIETFKIQKGKPLENNSSFANLNINTQKLIIWYSKLSTFEQNLFNHHLSTILKTGKIPTQLKWPIQGRNSIFEEMVEMPLPNETDQKEKISPPIMRGGAPSLKNAQHAQMVLEGDSEFLAANSANENIKTSPMLSDLTTPLSRAAWGEKKIQRFTRTAIENFNKVANNIKNNVKILFQNVRMFKRSGHNVEFPIADNIIAKALGTDTTIANPRANTATQIIHNLLKIAKNKNNWELLRQNYKKISEQAEQQTDPQKKSLYNAILAFYAIRINQAYVKQKWFHINNKSVTSLPFATGIEITNSTNGFHCRTKDVNYNMQLAALEALIAFNAGGEDNKNNPAAWLESYMSNNKRQLKKVFCKSGKDRTGEFVRTFNRMVAYSIDNNNSGYLPIRKLGSNQEQKGTNDQTFTNQLASYKKIDQMIVQDRVHQDIAGFTTGTGSGLLETLQQGKTFLGIRIHYGEGENAHPYQASTEELATSRASRRKDMGKYIDSSSSPTDFIAPGTRAVAMAKRENKQPEKPKSAFIPVSFTSPQTMHLVDLPEGQAVPPADQQNPKNAAGPKAAAP